MGPKEEKFPQWSFLKQIQLKSYLEKISWVDQLWQLIGNFPRDAHR